MPKNAQAKSASQDSVRVAPRVGIFSAETYVRLHAVHFAFYGVMKRMIGFLMAVLLIVLLAPLMVVISIAIKIDSPGPVLFKQERVGKNGRVFRILKFRSMAYDNDLRDSSCEDAYTRVGRVIRRLSLDEIPQLFNIVVGQMAFVGPRPWVVEYWTNMNEEERERGRVLPGITGLAQVKGRNGLSVFEKIGYDLQYVQNYSLKQDVKVVILTVVTVLTGSDVDAGKAVVRDDIRDLKAR